MMNDEGRGHALTFGTLGNANRALRSTFCILHSSFAIQKYSGSLPDFHLMLHPMLAF
jgi:hypothetical protein